MVRNKLQPALKYIAPQPHLINKYKVHGGLPEYQIDDQ